MNKKKRNKNVAIVLILILIGVIIFSQAKPLAILSQSSITVNEGTDNKVYWVVTGTAENLDSGYTFNMYPSKYTKTDGTGTTVTPTESLTLQIKTREKSCTYQLYEKKSTYLRITIIPIIWYYDLQYTYKVLGSPEKSFLIDFTPNKGNTITLDGSLQNSKEINDPDGKGKVTVQTQGALETKYSCPTNADVAVIGSGTKTKIVDKSDLETALNNIGSSLIGKIINLILNGGSDIYNVIANNFEEKQVFTTDFTTYPSVYDSYIKGLKDMGNPVFTITADQDYFDSVVYTPPTSSDPYISSISCPSIKMDSSGSISVLVKNRNNNQGSVTLSVSAPYSYFTPTSENFVLSGGGSSTRYFSETANNIKITNTITVKVCTNNQFGSNTCDTKVCSQAIIQEGTYCGDGICQSTENNATCPQDCHDVGDCKLEGLDCTSNNECCKGLSCIGGVCSPSSGKCTSCWDWARNIFRKEADKCESTNLVKTKWYNPFTWVINLFGLSKQTILCPVLFIIVIIVFIFSILFGSNYVDKFPKIDSKILWGVNIIIAGLLAWLVYKIFWIGLIIFAVYIIFTRIIGKTKVYRKFKRRYF